MVTLHEQQAAAKNLDPNVRTLLKSVLADIDRVLEEQAAESDQAADEPSPASDETRPESESIVARLAETAREFEGTHPALAGTVGSLIDALGNMGV
jgi:acetylornithine deacetylase/succinyl-diaminopimelate desuccinylase-like protein